MMGRVRGAWGVVGYSRLIRCDRVQHLNTGDCVVRHILIEEIVRLVVWRFDWIDVKAGEAPVR